MTLAYCNSRTRSSKQRAFGNNDRRFC